jgi:hypothetical protein
MPGAMPMHTDKNQPSKSPAPSNVEKYKVIFQGRTIKGQQVDDVKINLASLLRKIPADIEKLFSGNRVILKKDASLESCKIILNKLLEAGAECVIEKQVSGPKSNDQNLSKTKLDDAAGPAPPTEAVTDGANHHSNNAKIINIADYKKVNQQEENEFSDIVHNISTQLTGDQENDLRFLKNEVYKFSQHKYAAEIIRAIGRMMYDVLPLDKKNELFKIFSSLSISSDIILNESKLKIQEGNLEEAEKLIISILPDENFFEDSQNSTYFCFNNPFEEIYYSIKFNPQKEINYIPNFDTDRFLVYA